MEVFDNRYYKVTRFFLDITGHWPYDRSWTKTLKRIFVCLYPASWVITQLCKFLTTEYSNDLMIEIFTPITASLIAYVKFFTCSYTSDTVLKILEGLRHDWNALTDPNEVKVLHKYAGEGRMLILVYIGFIYVGLFFYTVILFSPYAMDMIVPLNETRTRFITYVGEYFVDLQVYFVPIAWHILSCCLVFMTMTAAGDIIVISLLYHLSAKFSILSYRLEHIIDEHVHRKQAVYDDHRSRIMLKKISSCVQFHRQNMESVKVLATRYNVSVVIQMMLGLVVIACSLLRMVETLTMMRHMGEMVACTLLALGYILFSFLVTLSAQSLLDCSTEIFYRVYSARWYEAPLEVQKAMLFILQRTIEPCGINIASFLTLSIQVFSDVMQTSLSYFTVLYSMRR